jgi:hypothetical protein
MIRKGSRRVQFILALPVASSILAVTVVVKVDRRDVTVDCAGATGRGLCAAHPHQNIVTAGSTDMHSRGLWVCAIGLLTWSQILVAINADDEAWIEGYMSRPGQSAKPTSIRSGYRIAWADLPRFVGVRVTIVTDTGRIHHGRIEKVDQQTLLLRATQHGGYAELDLRRDQVARTELE